MHWPLFSFCWFAKQFSNVSLFLFIWCESFYQSFAYFRHWYKTAYVNCIDEVAHCICTSRLLYGKQVSDSLHCFPYIFFLLFLLQTTTSDRATFKHLCLICTNATNNHFKPLHFYLICSYNDFLFSFKWQRRKIDTIFIKTFEKLTFPR